MTFTELKHICNPAAVSGPKPAAIGTFTQDSRTVEQHSVFIAVEGSQTDGHQFINKAIENGASVIICEKTMQADADVCFLRVENTRSLIGPLAQAFQNNPARQLRTIGITGTNGKTTVATLTYQVLQSLGEQPSLLSTVTKHIAGETLESRLTTEDPIELAHDMRQMVDAGSSCLVMEVSSHALSQQRTEGIQFGAAAFTNLSHDHLDYHKDVQSYAAAKKRLFDGLNTDSTAIINNDDEQAAFMARDCDGEVILFGFEDSAPVQCRLIKNGRHGMALEIDGATVKSPLIGQFNAYNVAQAFLICRALGYERQSIADALESAPGAPGRLERVQQGEKPRPLVLVDYAHTPSALKNILQTLTHFKEPGQTLHVVFGCGGDRDRTKRPKMAAIAEEYADFVTITSDNPRTEDPDAIIDDAMQGFSSPENVSRITDRRQAIERTIAASDEHSIIVIAGKGHETYQEINGTRQPFDDREIARRALTNWNGNPKTSEG